MSTKRILVKLMGTACLSLGAVMTLFLFSEQQVHRNNAFTRRYPPHPVVKQYHLDLGHNSYYVAGWDDNVLYLGNRTAPWHLLRIHLGTQDTTHIRMEPRNKNLRYRSLETRVLPPYFYVMDGTIPFILRGRTGPWIAEAWMEGTAFFNRAVPIDSTTVFIRTISSHTQRSTLGLILKSDHFQVRLDTSLLEIQLDGIFDVDGMLLKSGDGPYLGYLYYYRNEFMVFDPKLKKTNRQRTIDTVQRSQIRVAEPNRQNQVQMQAPPLIINRSGSMDGNVFLVQSDRLGRNESRSMLEQASIIDVYNHKKGTYEFSFYLYHMEHKKVREFAIHGTHVIALIGDHLSVYRTGESYFDQTTNTKKTTGL
ncbi:MAG: hypothetical protein H2058_11870 [Muricauda sp.]|nr:hypothetical protein [Allomuricauda sp.]MBA4745943.1 hypothetical protein [Allomuricauda sp.]